MTCGVPKGSVLGPLLWNIMYDPVLKFTVPDGITLIGCADKLAMVGVEKTKECLEWAMNKAASVVTEWISNTGLTLAAHKTEVVVLEGQRKPPVLTLKVEGHCITSRAAVKYLGVWIGCGYNLGMHVTKTVPKVEKTAKSLARYA